MKKFISFISFLIVIGALVLEWSGSGFLSKSDTSGSTPVSTVPKDFKSADSWDYSANPLYYKSLGASGIDPKSFPAEGKINYSTLDELGRSGVARGTITYDMYKSSIGSKQSFTNADNPSGFDTVIDGKRINWNSVYNKQEMLDATGKVYRGWFYNRSHLIGDALGGGEIRVNVVTGTRFQNVGSRSNDGGMRYPESTVEDYFKINGKNSGIVWYEATPNYEGDEIVPRSVTVKFKSSDGKLDESVLVSNTSQGFVIDYNTGNFYKE